MCDPDHSGDNLEDFYELETETTQILSEIPIEEQEGAPDPGLLIEAIQAYEYLYLSNKSYKDTKKKQLAWQHIRTVLNCSVEECMKLWKHLRDRFIKENNKFPSGAPTSKWIYFDSMLFYSKFTKKRNTFTATKNIPPSRQSTSPSVWSSVTMDTVTSPVSRTESPSEEPSPGRSTRGEEPPVAGPSGVKRKVPTGRTPPTPVGCKRKVNKEEKLDILGMANSITNVFENRQAVPRNPNSTFVQYLYEELESMPEEEAKQKRKINAVI